MFVVSGATLVALLGYQFMRIYATWLGNWETNGSTGDAGIKMSKMMLSGNNLCVAVCISSGESRDNQGYGLNSGD
jgi:hypothetical protein